MEEFCKFYADPAQKLLYTDIIEKRKSIVDKMRRDMLTGTKYDDVNDTNFNKLMNTSKLSKIINLIDEDFF